eukprot:TRINITY_DN29706_c0_g1_i2.p1 TRINITY_DN29706_c0_g1~~TRINITY_DN29706_c0_g1_i2.p1  ORF type:complete len:709 (-),score=156.86 TRINITY_DN29706_c0_g1_i2:191-2317(-)
MRHGSLRSAGSDPASTMFAWAQTLVTGTNPEFPFKPEQESPELMAGNWVMRHGVDANSSVPVSIHSFTIADAGPDELEAAKRAVKRLKSMRHPNILKFLGCIETSTEISMATERVTPLDHLLRQQDPLADTTAHPQALTWGLIQLTQALGFVHQAGLVYGSVSPGCVMVTRGGDWKLAGFEATVEFSAVSTGALPDTRCLRRWWPKAYTPPETATDADYPQHAWDMWGVGCLIYELWGENPNPQALKSAWSKLVSKAATTRLPPARLLTHAALKSTYTSTLLFLENTTLKSDQEKIGFYQSLQSAIEEMPEVVRQHKVLPHLMESAQTGGGCAVEALAPLLLIAKSLPTEEFQRMVEPVVLQLFGSPDRALRVSLLQHMPLLVANLSPTVLQETVYAQVVLGLNDTAPQLRDMTVVSLCHIVPKMASEEGDLLTESKADDVSKQLMRMMVDKEPVIRTNSVVCLGKIAEYLTPTVRAKVLCASLAKTAKDPFGKARESTCLSLIACHSRGLFEIPELAGRVLPVLGGLALDPLESVRAHAIRMIHTVATSLEKHSDATKAKDAEAAAKNVGNELAVQEDTPSSDWTSWAMKGITDMVVADQPGGAGNTTATSTATPAEPIRRPPANRSPASKPPAMQNVAPAPAPAPVPTISEPEPGTGWDDEELQEDGWDEEELPDLQEPPPSKPAKVSRPPIAKRPVAVELSLIHI